MVRRPASVLSPAVVLGLVAAFAAAEGYMLAAPILPEISPVNLSIAFARLFGSTALFGGVAVAAVVAGADQRRAWLVAAAGFAVTAIVDLAHVGAAATPVEAVAYAALGMALALGLLEPVLVLALPVIITVADVASTVFGGPSEALAHAGQTKPGDPLSLETPDWGNGLPAGRMGFSDVVIAGALIAWAQHYDLRPRATAVALWAATVLASMINIALSVAIPVLPLMAVAFFAVNADRLPAFWRQRATR